MKSLIAMAGVAVVAAWTPVFARAQTAPVTGVYGNIGYTGLHNSDIELGAIQGRLGYRLNNWLGVEGELAAGVKDDKVAVAPGVDAKVKLRHEEAIYGVGFMPLSPKFDLIGRVGYGGSTIRTSAAGLHDTDSSNSWNLGAGAQYHFDGKNGVRVDYTRQEALGQADNANVWSVAYSRRF
jgi:hypothetical protein